ncbi:MAG TPA: dihydrofolate reductase family protein [Candidatus Nanoarchaeia archaeon]|nr:dihydrofolate reductase family protein [Candidatus Nanoarchaeia archaeon]
MRKLIVSEWISLDGVFDADPQYFGKWWMPYHSEERATHITKTIGSADALLLGSTTYNMLAPYWSTQKNDDNGPAAKLNSMAKYVVASTPPEFLWNNTQKIIKENVVEEIRKLKNDTGGNILILGSAILTQSLIEADLIDEYRFLISPIIMGEGKRFFKEEATTTKLALIETKTLPLGVIALVYETAKK